MITYFKSLDTIQTALAASIIIYTTVFAIYLAIDCLKHKEDFSSSKLVPLAFIGAITNFLDTLGIGSFATTQAGFKFTKSSPDDTMPGTLNVGDTIPVVTEFVCFITFGNVAGMTLVFMIAAAIVGAVLGASIVTKLPVQKIRVALGAALIILAIALLLKNLQIGVFKPTGDPDAVQKLEGIKLVIGVIGNFFLGALMTVGVGLYAPCMALVGALGLNVSAAFPIMMGSCAYLMPSAGIKFIKEGKYDRKASVMLAIFGVIGVIIANFIVKSMNMYYLTFVVILVMLYTSYTFFRDSKKSESK